MDNRIEHNAFMNHIKIPLCAVTALILSACFSARANPSPPAAPMVPKENTAVNTTRPVPVSVGGFRPHTLDEFPEMTPEEVGRRFLKLIDSLKSFDELTEERVRAVMRVPLRDTGFGNLDFDVYLVESGWNYIFEYTDEHDERTRGRVHLAEYRFRGGKYEHADMALICKLDTSAYISALKQMGFKKLNKKNNLRRDRFDFLYYRDNVQVSILEQKQSGTPDRKIYRGCVDTISIGRLAIDYNHYNR